MRGHITRNMKIYVYEVMYKSASDKHEISYETFEVPEKANSRTATKLFSVDGKIMIDYELSKRKEELRALSLADFLKYSSLVESEFEN